MALVGVAKQALFVAIRTCPHPAPRAKLWISFQTRPQHSRPALQGGRMTSVSVQGARQFVDEAELPPAPRPRARLNPDLAPLFNRAKDEAAVVGSDVVSFVTGVTPERREAIVNSSLLAQLVAKKKVP